MIRPGDPWGGPVSGPAAARGAGGDADLAALVRAHPGARVEFRPDPSCDLARAVGLSAAATGAAELPVDAVSLDAGGVAVNVVVAGPPPDRLRWWHRRRPVTVRVDDRVVFDGRATTVVVANGQFRHGADLVPRGHPGDGRLEVQVYALPPAQRRSLRARLASGSHLPHPGIRAASGRRIEARWKRRTVLEVDGRPARPQASLGATVVAEAFTLMV